MFNIFKNEIGISSIVKLYLITGKEIEGEVIEIGENHVLLKTPDNTQTRFFDKLIGGWDVISSVKNIENEKVTKVKEEDSLIKTVIDESKVEKDTLFLGKQNIESIRFQRSKEESNILNKNIEVKNPLEEIKGKYKSIDELKDKITEIENEKLVPANGIIIKHSEERGFGFLRNSKGQDLFFGYRDIIDEELKSSLNGEKQNLNIHVVYTLSENYKGNKATIVHLPWKVSKCIELASSYIENREINNGLLLCNQVLNVFPNNITTENLLLKLNKGKRKNHIITNGSEHNYLIGKKAKDNKNYEEAIKYLNLSIQNNERFDSAVKDLASCYQELEEIEKGIELIEKYLNLLKTDSATYNFVANYYSAARRYDKAILYFDKLLEITTQDKHIEIYSRKIYCLIQLRNFDKAKSEVEKIIIINKSHPFIEFWKEKINEYKEIGNETYMSITEDIETLDTITGTTKIILNDLELNKYEGIPEDSLVKSDFDKKDLDILRKRLIELINDKGNRIPSERAKWLLTEIKLVKMHQLDDEDKLNALISRYCIAKAQSYAINNYYDLMRTYYLELFKINKDLHFIIQPLILCVLSYSCNWEWIKESKYINRIGDKEINTFKKTGLKEAINIHLSSGKPSKIIIDFLIENSVFNIIISNHILSIFLEFENLKNLIIEYFGISDATDIDITEVWRNAVKENERKRKLFNVNCKQISTDLNLEITLSNLSIFLMEIKSFAITNIDNNRYQDFLEIISEAQKFIETITFEDKERINSTLKTLVLNFEESVTHRPTVFSLENLMPIIRNISSCIKKSFLKVLESSKPRISIAILGESRFLDENNKVNIQLSIKNERGCSPIHDLKINIQDNYNIKLLDNINISSETLRGGDERIIQIPLIISPNVILQEATTINVNLEYHSREKEEINELPYQQLSIRFYSSSEFQTIVNPYSAIADSGPVKDENMFFGRESIIDDIFNSLIMSPSQKFIDIYGQKRSGKSSLLFHLSKKLKNTNKFICIDFTLGTSTTYDSSSFFWLILDGIERFIENFPNNNDQKPHFKTPKIKELSLNPSIIFYEFIKDLKDQMKNFDDWKDRKLILLIDEFTYLYSAALKNSLEPVFMKTWKGMLEKDLFSAIVIGQDVMPKFKAKFPNEFGVFEDRRLTYLKKIDAEKLIEKPIWNTRNNKSRFIGNAVNKVLDYTSQNPYYIQIFCARLVDFMNENKLNSVTEADVINVAKSFIEGIYSLPIDKFDNLLNAGDADLEAFSQDEILEILRQIANNSRFLGSCNRDSIYLKGDEYDNQILEDLFRRDVINCPNRNFYRIQVQIFNDWLLKN